MQDFSFEGVGRINGGEYGRITIEGVGTCSNSIKAENIDIEGVFNCSGEVEAGSLYCEGVANFKSNIRAKKISIEGVVSAKGASKIEAEEILCNGVLNADGEISADILRADGCINAREIVGDQIRIDSEHHINKVVNFFKQNKSNSKVKTIEATTIEISGVRADTVNGRDITIGPDCTIENLDCSGTLFIHADSHVKNITGNYTVRC